MDIICKDFINRISFVIITQNNHLQQTQDFSNLLIHFLSNTNPCNPSGIKTSDNILYGIQKCC